MPLSDKEEKCARVLQMGRNRQMLIFKFGSIRVRAIFNRSRANRLLPRTSKWGGLLEQRMSEYGSMGIIVVSKSGKWAWAQVDIVAWFVSTRPRRSV